MVAANYLSKLLIKILNSSCSFWEVSFAALWVCILQRCFKDKQVTALYSVFLQKSGGMPRIQWDCPPSWVYTWVQTGNSLRGASMPAVVAGGGGDLLQV